MSHQEPHEAGRGSRAKARRRLHLRDVSGEVDTAPYNGIGTELRAARLRAGVDLPVAAAELRISFRYLQAIEEGHFAELPGAAYAQGFLRSYAEYLDIDADTVADAYKAEAADARPSSRLDFPSPLDRGRLPTGRILAASIILAGLVYAGWYLVNSDERRTAEVVTPVPERLARLVVEESLTSEGAQTDAGDALAASAATVETASDDVETPRSDAATPPAGVETADADDAPPRGVAQDLIAALPLLRQDETGAGLTSVAAREIAPADAPVADDVRPLTAPPIAATPPRQLPEVPTRPQAPLIAADEPAGAPPALRAQQELAQVAAARRVSELADGAADAAARGPGTPVAAAVDVPPAPPPVLRAREDVIAAVGGAYVPQVYGAGTESPRVVLIARLESWVQVRSGGGELLLTRILRPGDRYLVPDRNDLLMMTGNAGALQIYVDGKAIPAIGPIGAVRRDVSLAPGRLLSGAPDSR